jgi:2,3-bisphosphoglycerate-dependent phosphoglycerate mutase
LFFLASLWYHHAFDEIDGGIPMGTLVLIRHGQSQWNLENRFTGWVDVPLTDLGRKEALQGAGLLKHLRFDRAFTSSLVRAQETLRIVLETIGQPTIPVEKDQALNERHYGALQGLNKAETAKKYGEEQVHLWRRSYDIPPPKDKTQWNPDGVSESLKDTAARTLPYFNKAIWPLVKVGQSILVAAHGNSLRSIVMHLDRLSKEQVLELNIATGAPIIYEFDGAGTILKKTVHELPPSSALTGKR